MAQLILFGYAFLLGLLFNALPGAITAESLRRGLRGGFGAALAVQIGSLAGDGLWVVLGVSGTAGILLIPHAALPLMLAGVGFIAYLTYESFRDAYAPMPDFTADAAMKKRGDLLAGIFLSISNPLNVVYWVALGGTIVTITGSHPTAADYAIFIGGFMASSLMWCFTTAGLIAWVRRRLNEIWWRRLHIICGVGLLLVLISLVGNVVEFVGGIE